jgi:hypothetical protein
MSLGWNIFLGFSCFFFAPFPPALAAALPTVFLFVKSACCKVYFRRGNYVVHLACWSDFCITPT